MSSYLIRRLATSIVVLTGISLFIFFLLHSLYPSPAIDVLPPRTSFVAIAGRLAFGPRISMAGDG